MARQIENDDDFRSKLLKLIPSEVIGAYTVLQGIVPDPAAQPREAAIALTIVCVVLLAATPFILSRLYSVTKRAQIAATSVSFLVWVFSLGGPFRAWDAYAKLGWYQPYIGSVALVLWTVLIPLFVGGRPAPEPVQADPAR